MNIFTRKSGRYSLLILSFLILMGCSFQPPPPQPFSCTSFSESFWSEFNFYADSLEDVLPTVLRLWDLDKEQVSYKVVHGTTPTLSWTAKPDGKNRANYYAVFREESLALVEVYWRNGSPSLGQIVDCLGAPEQYFAYEALAPEASSLSLVLLYTTKGLIVRYNSPYTSVLRPELPSAFHPHTRIDKLMVVAPGTPEQMAEEVRYDSVFTARAVCLRKSWPGSIEAMEIAAPAEAMRC